VIDEMETVLNIFKTDFLEQGNKKLKKKIWETFKRLLTNSTQIILLDAFTTTKTTQIGGIFLSARTAHSYRGYDGYHTSSQGAHQQVVCYWQPAIIQCIAEPQFYLVCH
jgi:hypothetical protein